MTAEDEVLAAAEARASALGRRDAAALTGLLHPRFAWTSHKGASFDRTTYVRSNTAGSVLWHGQQLENVTVTVVGDTAVLRCTVSDDVDAVSEHVDSGTDEELPVDGTLTGRQLFRMPMTQVWIRTTRGWKCLAGHAGPRMQS